MELKLLHYSGISWYSRILGEQALLLEPQVSENKLHLIHKLANQIEHTSIKGVVDVIPAYESLGIIFDERIINHGELLNSLSKLDEVDSEIGNLTRHEVSVCYELGLDWVEVIQYSGVNKDTFIKQHSSQIYTVAMMGFIPGFVFLEGLSENLSVPRKISPRTNIPGGSVGIGGNQTGIYSLESPGGWNVIGRTKASFFDISKNPPTQLKAGDQIKFKPISVEEFKNG